MSYPYNTDPWADEASSAAPSAAPAGYSNPVNQFYDQYGGGQQAGAATNQPTNAQYNDPWSAQDPYTSASAVMSQTSYGAYDQPSGLGFQDQVGYSTNQSGQQQQQQALTGQPTDQQQQAGVAGKQSQRGPVGRFLASHLPFCGSLFDFCSGLNLPFIDALFQHVNKDLLVSKMFYFFFYSAFGSLFPLMGVYFKQLGMNPAQVGILTGVRPFIEIFSAPFWNSLAERFNKRKALLIFSLFSWIIFTYSLAHIRPPASACIAFNDTDYELYIPYSGNALANPDASQFTEEQQQRGLELALKENNNQEEATEQQQGVDNRKPEVGEGSGIEEAKERVLAGEETQIDHRRRRRRKRESPFAKRLARSYYAHSEPAESSDQEAEADEASADEEPEVGEEQTGSKKLKIIKSSGTKKNEQESEQEQEESEEEEEQVNNNKKELGKLKVPMKAKPEVKGTTSKESKEEEQEEEEEQEVEKEKEKEAAKQKQRKFKDRHKTPPTHIVGMSPISVEYAADYNKTKHSQFVTPMFSTVVYKLDDIKSVFFLLLLLISLGEFFSAPAITLADSATLRYLGDQVDLYCRQRMFGSLSWAVTLLLVGMALDNATSIADHPCGPHLRERSYTVCYIIFSLLMGCALLTASQFRFDDDNQPPEGSGKSNQNKQQQMLLAQTADGTTGTTTMTANYAGPATFEEQQQLTYDPNVDPYAATQPRSIFNTAPPVNGPPPGVLAVGEGPNSMNGGPGSSGKEKFEFLDKWRSAVFAQRTRELPQWVNVFRQFSGNPFHLTYLFITWFLGCGVGLVFTFLFWHLQDVGGSPTLFGICSVINHISEILAYFFSFSFIKRFGHTRVLAVGLGCNAIRFVYVAFLTNPYYALPFELVQGITHAACFAACCSFMSHKSAPELKTSTQGVMQGLHHGIGRACGTLLGGFLINCIGSRAAFALYGILSGFVLAGFLHVRKKATAEELDIKVDDSDALGGYGAPQGVPSAKPSKLF